MQAPSVANAVGGNQISMMLKTVTKQ